MGMKFKVGDRIVLKRARFGMPAGTRGEIWHLYRYEADPYEVRFEGSNIRRFCSTRDIDLETARTPKAPTFTVKYKPPSFDNVDAAIDYATKLATATGVNAEVIRA